MTTSEKRSLFIAPLLDGAVEFIKARGAVTISQLAEHLASAGVNLDGDYKLTGETVAYRLGNGDFLRLPVIATGSYEFVLITSALLVNRRTIRLDLSNPTLVKLTWDGPADVPSADDKTSTTGHYHVLFVRDPGGPEQFAECDPGTSNLSLTCYWLDEIYLPETINEGWEAIWIVGCGPGRCRRDEICDLPVEEWGEPHWRCAAVADDDEDPYPVCDVDADEPPF